MNVNKKEPMDVDQKPNLLEPKAESSKMSMNSVKMNITKKEPMDVDQKPNLLEPKAESSKMSFNSVKMNVNKKEPMDVDQKPNLLEPKAKLSKMSMNSVKMNVNVKEAMDVDQNPNLEPKAGSSKMSLASPTGKGEKEKPEESSAKLPEELQTLFSNFYMNATGRLCITYPIRCAQDVSFCHENHYIASKPKSPCHTHMDNLKLAWQQGRYMEFTEMASDMCVRCEFPGESIFGKLLELILTAALPKQIFISIVKTFRLYIQAFPPCWQAIRSHYVKYFTKTLRIPKISTKKANDPLSKAGKIFDLMFILIERTYDDYAEKLKSVSQDPQVAQSESSEKSELSPWNWQDCIASGRQEFFNLKSDERFERINIIMDLLLQVLEVDLTVWLLHNFRNPKCMFRPKTIPLVATVFEMNKRARSTLQVERLFHLFSRAVAMNVGRKHLKIMERYLTLIMAVNFTADIEVSLTGIVYPCLPDNAKNLIKKFYSIFQSHNKTSIKPFLAVIDLLRLPYVKFEFIDNLLQTYGFSPNTKMCPEKVFCGLLHENWSKYKCQSEIIDSEGDLSREQFIELLLQAFHAYSTMHGLLQAMFYIEVHEKIPPLTIVSQSVHHQPNREDPTAVFDLEEMAKDKDFWEKCLRIQVRMAKPKIFLIKPDMCTDKNIVQTYLNDLRYCWHLSNAINKLNETNPDIDLKKWLRLTNLFRIGSTS